MVIYSSSFPQSACFVLLSPILLLVRVLACPRRLHGLQVCDRSACSAFILRYLYPIKSIVMIMEHGGTAEELNTQGPTPRVGSAWWASRPLMVGPFELNQCPHGMHFTEESPIFFTNITGAGRCSAHLPVETPRYRLEFSQSRQPRAICVPRGSAANRERSVLFCVYEAAYNLYVGL